MSSIFKIASLVTILAITLFLIGCSSVLSPEKKYESVVQNAPFDVVIVPGFPHQKDNWSMVVKCRVYWAVYLYNQGITKNIIFSGSAVYTPYIESEIMALYAEEMGVPKEHIFIETKAEHSAENLYYSYLLAQENRFKSIAVASDAIQCGFLKKFKRKFKLNDVQFIPIVYEDLQLNECPDPHINDQEAYVSGFVSLKDRQSLFMRYRCSHGYKVKKLIQQTKNCPPHKPNDTDEASLEQNMQNHP